jgi:hypothetical protein
VLPGVLADLDSAPWLENDGHTDMCSYDHGVGVVEFERGYGEAVGAGFGLAKSGRLSGRLAVDN